jgi:hypothetical protein
VDAIQENAANLRLEREAGLITDRELAAHVMQLITQTQLVARALRNTITSHANRIEELECRLGPILRALDLLSVVRHPIRRDKRHTRRD